MRILDIMIKDLTQIVRDWKTAFFLLVMPIAFTLLFGFVFGGTSGGAQDPRLPVGFLDQDGDQISQVLRGLLEKSEVIRFVEGVQADEMEKKVDDDELVAAALIPAGYSQKIMAGEPVKIVFVVDNSTTGGMSAQNELQTTIAHLMSAVRTAKIAIQAYERVRAFSDAAARQAFFAGVIQKTLTAWETPPVLLEQVDSRVDQDEPEESNAFAHSSPGMVSQFVIAGLMGAAEVIVVERKSRSLQRLLTTPVRRSQIIIGHYLAMVVLIFVQVAVLILFGQLLLGLDYFSQPLATFLMILATSLFAAGLGLLIGTLAKTEEHVVIFTLIPMFVLAGLGGAWVPLEVTSQTVQTIGHLTTVAWMMDGFKGILLRGWGLSEVLLPVGVLLGFAVLCVGFSIWKFKFE